MNSLPAYPLPANAFAPTDSPELVLDQYSNLFDVLADSQENGLLDVLPENQAEASNPRANASRYETIRSRLKWLGYKPGRATINKVSDRFRKAVLAFQKDAYITEDGWVGTLTWHALDVLVGFESLINPHDWFLNGHPKPALFRAIQLRLWSLGLADRQPKSGEPVPSPAIFDSFRRVIQIFNITSQSMPDDVITPELVALLFDQDQLVSALAGARGSVIEGFASLHHFKIQVPAGMRSRDANNLAARFITQTAMIELYLHGFNIEIGKRVHYAVSKPDADGRNKHTRLFLAFHAFWKQLGDASHNPHIMAQSILPEFFEILERTRQEAGATTRPGEDYSLELARQFKENNNFRTNFWSQLKSLGKRLWDGLNRIWRWIKAKSSKILEYGANMARAFFRFGLKSFKILRAAGKAVTSSIQFLIKKVMPGSSPETAQVTHDLDFDFKVIVNPAADRETLKKVTAELSHRSWLFALGCKILALVLGILRGALTLAGWPGIFYSLVKSYSQIKTIYQQLNKLIQETATSSRVG